MAGALRSGTEICGSLALFQVVILVPVPSPNNVGSLAPLRRLENPVVCDNNKENRVLWATSADIHCYRLG